MLIFVRQSPAMRLTQLLNVVAKTTKEFSNLPERYIERAMNQVYWRNPKGLQYRSDVVIKRKKFKFSTHRPWTREFQEMNSRGRCHEKIFVEPIKKWSFFKGDRVEVLTGMHISLSFHETVKVFTHYVLYRIVSDMKNVLRSLLCSLQQTIVD